MTGFEPQTLGIGSDLSTNWATTTFENSLLLNFIFQLVMKDLKISSEKVDQFDQMATLFVYCLAI